jgi:glycosidase
MCLAAAALLSVAYSQDSVDVVFRYAPPGSPASVTLPGEFNSWSNSAWPMSNQGGVWVRTARLRVGGHVGGGVPGAYQYKFYYSGVAQWPNDPLNHHVNNSDNNNSFLPIKHPTIYQFLPNQRNPIVNTNLPTISAYIFPQVGLSVDTSALSLVIDGVVYPSLGAYYNIGTQQLVYTPSSPLPNGTHTVILRAGTNADTVTFSTQGGYVRILNQGPFATRKIAWTINGSVQDSSVTSARVIRNGSDTAIVPVVNARFSILMGLFEGSNTFVALADSSGITKVSSPFTISRTIDHVPTATITFQSTGNNVALSALSSTDPDSGQAASLAFHWSVDSNNPSPLPGVNGNTSSEFQVGMPTIPGEYYIGLIAEDPDGNKDTTRNYFIVNHDLTISIPTIASNPRWAKEARVYFLFPKAVSAAGTIPAAAHRLKYIKDLGFSVIWMMPVMRNAYPIDNGIGPGYNIVDFYNVAPEYGTNQDFKDFVAQAHSLGLKVILDVTPNHTSRFHPWAEHAHAFKQNSPYWGWYQHQLITHNTNGLGQSVDADGFYYYSGFSDQLLNVDWTDIDARTEMINVYKHWIREFALDGYRFDVYWGPYRRYGTQFFGDPIRAALKHGKPDILLLGEDDGTGSGTETIYADHVSGSVRGGLDAAYDFKTYFNQIRNFGFSNTGITNLHNELDNSGYYPGENSLYMRFMESQDEDRIYYLDPTPSTYFSSDTLTSFRRTMPMASVVFTSPGFPMLWNGQEVGWGYGIAGDKLARNRSIINWNFRGRDILASHYQRLAHIRAQVPAFTQHKRDTNGDGAVTSADSSDFVKVSSANAIYYAFTRPYDNRNGVTVVNFSGFPLPITLNLLTPSALRFVGGIQSGARYYVNNLMDNTRREVLGSELSALQMNLLPYESTILTISTTPDSVVIPNPFPHAHDGEPSEFVLRQNYPNPFNPRTTIRFEIPDAGYVTLTVYDVLGQEVATLIDGIRDAGSGEVIWHAVGLASGVYFYRLTTRSASAQGNPGNQTSTRKMLLLR